MSFTKNVLQPLAEDVLITLGLTTTVSAADAWIRKKMLGFGASGSGTMTLMISNNETEDIMKTVKCLEDSWQRALFKEMKMKQKKQMGGFLSVFLTRFGKLYWKRVYQAVDEIVKTLQAF